MSDGVQTVRREHCHWTEQEEGHWTECEHIFTFECDGVEENSFAFCPFCGGRLIEVLPKGSGCDEAFNEEE